MHSWVAQTGFRYFSGEDEALPHLSLWKVSVPAQRLSRNCPSAWAERQNIWISGNTEGQSVAAPKCLVLAQPLSRIEGGSSRAENCLLKWEVLISRTVWLHDTVCRCPGWIKKAAGYCGNINSRKYLHTHGRWSIVDGRLEATQRNCWWRKLMCIWRFGLCWFSLLLSQDTFFSAQEISLPHCSF